MSTEQRRQTAAIQPLLLDCLPPYAEWKEPRRAHCTKDLGDVSMEDGTEKNKREPKNEWSNWPKQVNQTLPHLARLIFLQSAHHLHYIWGNWTPFSYNISGQTHWKNSTHCKKKARKKEKNEVFKAKFTLADFTTIGQSLTFFPHFSLLLQIGMRQPIQWSGLYVASVNTLKMLVWESTTQAGYLAYQKFCWVTQELSAANDGGDGHGIRKR